MAIYNKMAKKKIPTNSYYKSLAKSILLIGVIVPFIPMLLVSGIIYYQFQASFKDKVHVHFSQLIEDTGRDVDYFLKEKSEDIRFLSISYSNEELRDGSSLDEMLKKLAARYGNTFTALALLKGKGVLIAYAGPVNPETGKGYKEQKQKDVRRGRKTAMGLLPEMQGEPYLSIELKRQWEEKPLFLRAFINPEALDELVKNVSKGEDGLTRVLTTGGQFFTMVPEDKKQLGFIAGQVNQMKKKGMSGSFIFTHKDLSGIKNIYSITSCNKGQWILVHQQKFSTAFAGLKKAKSIAAGAFLIVSALIFINAYNLSKKMVYKIALADKEKEKMNEKMFQTGKLAAIGELASGIAHEINNPVAIMVEEAGWIDDLLSEEEFSESKNLDEFKRALRQIRMQGKRCKEITHKLLSFARKSDSRVEEVQLHDFIEDIISISSKRAKLEGVAIEKEIQRDLPAVAVSPTELQQVILNLINNALDALEDKGGKIRISAKTSGESIVIEVSDTGPGIPLENISKIFDPFFTTKPVGKGTGLGLSICYGIIKKMGGEINVKSTVGEGSTFRIRIPLLIQRDESVEISGAVEGSLSKNEA